MDLNDLTQEQWDELHECKTLEDILALAQAEGLELTDDELQQVTGGSDGYVVGGSIWGGWPAVCRLVSLLRAEVLLHGSRRPCRLVSSLLGQA